MRKSTSTGVNYAQQSPKWEPAQALNKTHAKWVRFAGHCSVSKDEQVFILAYLKWTWVWNQQILSRQWGTKQGMENHCD